MAWAANTAAREACQKAGDVVAMVKDAATVIYKGDILITLLAAGLVTPTYETGEQYDSFVGVADETVLAAEAKTTIKVAISGVFLFKHASAAQTDVGLIAYSDVVVGPKNCTTGGAQPATHVTPLGKVVGIDGSTGLYVKICPAASPPNPTA